MAVTNEELLLRWLSESGRNDPHWLTHSDTYRVDKTTGMLSYVRRERDIEERVAVTRERLGCFSGDRFKNGIFILNGDGFNNMWITEAQARLRVQVQNSFTWQKTAVIPYQALDGAQIDIQSIKAIEITQDTNDSFAMMLGEGFSQRHLDKLRDLLQADISGGRMPDGWVCIEGHDNVTSQTWQGDWHNVRCRIVFYRRSRTDTLEVNRMNIWAQPEFGQWGWQQAVWANQSYLITRRADLPAGQDASYQTGWYWVENVHRLGSVVFTGISRSDNRRHRYISAFDMQEPGGLYFLAMLPDRGPCKTYHEALDLLAPEIVKKNRELGRNIYRQGDVFAIETDLTDEQVYEDAVTRVRRAVAMQDMETIRIGGTTPLEPADGEVWEYGTCPFCSSTRHRVGNGPQARAALSVHSTGHTADEVVVKDNGITFIRGGMYHDPQIEDATRIEPDHRPLALGPDVEIRNNGRRSPPEVNGKWYLAVRNTVPRVRRRRSQQVIEMPVDATSEREDAAVAVAV